MPTVKSLDSKHYTPRPQDSQPLRKTPYDQTTGRQPTSRHATGKWGDGQGEMNGGSKRRPGHDADAGID